MPELSHWKSSGKSLPMPMRKLGLRPSLRAMSAADELPAGCGVVLPPPLPAPLLAWPAAGLLVPPVELPPVKLLAPVSLSSPQPGNQSVSAVKRGRATRRPLSLGVTAFMRGFFHGGMGGHKQGPLPLDAFDYASGSEPVIPSDDSAPAGFRQCAEFRTLVLRAGRLHTRKLVSREAPRSLAARLLGVSRSTLYAKLEEHGLL